MVLYLVKLMNNIWRLPIEIDVAKAKIKQKSQVLNALMKLLSIY